jgi:uncharacterized protein with HEPN domain
VAGVGNVLRHDYDDVMPAIVWTIVSRDLHPLKAAMVRLRARYPLPE